MMPLHVQYFRKEDDHVSSTIFLVAKFYLVATKRKNAGERDDMLGEGMVESAAHAAGFDGVRSVRESI